MKVVPDDQDIKPAIKLAMNAEKVLFCSEIGYQGRGAMRQWYNAAYKAALNVEKESQASPSSEMLSSSETGYQGGGAIEAYVGNEVDTTTTTELVIIPNTPVECEGGVLEPVSRPKDMQPTDSSYRLRLGKFLKDVEVIKERYVEVIKDARVLQAGMTLDKLLEENPDKMNAVLNEVGGCGVELICKICEETFPGEKSLLRICLPVDDIHMDRKGDLNLYCFPCYASYCEEHLTGEEFNNAHPGTYPTDDEIATKKKGQSHALSRWKTKNNTLWKKRQHKSEEHNTSARSDSWRKVHAIVKTDYPDESNRKRRKRTLDQC